MLASEVGFLKRAMKAVQPIRNSSPKSIQRALKKDVLDGKRILIVLDMSKDPISPYSLFAGKNSESIDYHPFFRKPASYSSDILIFSCSERLSDPRRQQWVKKALEMFRRQNPDSVIFLCVEAPERLNDFSEFENSDVVDAVDRKTESGEYRLIEAARRIIELRQTE